MHAGAIGKVDESDPIGFRGSWECRAVEAGLFLFLFDCFLVGRLGEEKAIFSFNFVSIIIVLSFIFLSVWRMSLELDGNESHGMHDGMVLCCLVSRRLGVEFL